MAVSVSSGRNSPHFDWAFAPANTSYQWMRRLGPYAISTAASSTGCEARQMSGPVPSPSMKGMTGSSGTERRFPSHWMVEPEVGGANFFSSTESLHRKGGQAPFQETPSGRDGVAGE